MALLNNDYDVPLAGTVVLWLDVAVLVFLWRALRSVERQSDGAWTSLTLVVLALGAAAVYFYAAVAMQTTALPTVGAAAAPTTETIGGSSPLTVTLINLGLRGAALTLIIVSAVYRAFGASDDAEADDRRGASDTDAKQTKLDMARDAGLISSETHAAKSAEPGRA